MANISDTATLATRRRRAPMACRNCRKRKIKCVTNEDPPHNPCERCTRKGLHCEYVAVGDETPPSSPNTAYSNTSGYPNHGPDSSQSPQFGHTRQPSNTMSTSSTLSYTGMPHAQGWGAQTNSPYGTLPNSMSPPYGYQAGSLMQNNTNAAYPHQTSNPPFNHMQAYGGYSVPPGGQGMPGQPYHSSHPTYDLNGRRDYPGCTCPGSCICGRRI